MGVNFSHMSTALDPGPISFLPGFPSVLSQSLGHLLRAPLVVSSLVLLPQPHWLRPLWLPPCLHCHTSLISHSSHPAFTSGGCHSYSFRPGFLGHPPAHRSLQYLPSAFVLPSASPWCGAVAPTALWVTDRDSQSTSQRRKVGFREWRNGTMAPLLINSRPRV